MARTTMDAQIQAALGFYTGQLTYIEQEVLRQPYPEIKYPTILAVDTSAPDWTESVGFKTLDFRGKPQILGDKSKDYPLAEIASAMGAVDVHTFSLGYSYTLAELGKAMEMERAQGYGASINYLAEKPAGVRMLTEQWLDSTAFAGDPSVPSLAQGGLIKYPDVPVVSSGTLLGGPDMTIAQIIAQDDPNKVSQDLLNLFNNGRLRVSITQTRNVFRPTHVLLPAIQHGQIESYRIPNTSDTLLSYLERVTKLTFEPILQLAGAGAGGTDRMMFYTKDAKYAKFHMPMPFMLNAPVVSAGGLQFESAGLVRIAGTELRVPKSHLYVDGI
ncbi:DUF2184 domain-containing protein [Pseudomonas putida]|uniref:major capsid family protein n=1 Tax=Pseudomonas juntendi TaxID=2666183 RepID=UPI0012319A1D|nr:major capsid family protein [Pseudomonas juntendi]QEQ88679.1 DUF2184 domain-containing protein [Pseudomonas putida]